MITEEYLQQSRDPSYHRALGNKIFQALQNQITLDDHTVAETIRHYGLILKVGGEHYLSFAKKDTAQAVFASLRQHHTDYLDQPDKKAPFFNRDDNSFRITITSEGFDSLAHAPETDPRTVLRIKKPQDSQYIIRGCLKHLDLSKDIEPYKSREELMHDILEHGMFAVVDNTRAGIFLPDGDLSRKIYNGIWMHAPELLGNANYGNGVSRFGNSISRESKPRSLQEIHLSLSATQDLLTHNPLNSRQIINAGHSIGGDTQSRAEALVSHLDLIEGNNGLPTDDVARGNFVKLSSEREIGTLSSKEAISPSEVAQYLEVSRPNGSNVIDAAHLFPNNRQLPEPSSIEVEEFFANTKAEPKEDTPAMQSVEEPSNPLSPTRPEIIQAINPDVAEIEQPVTSISPTDAIPLIVPAAIAAFTPPPLSESPRDARADIAASSPASLEGDKKEPPLPETHTTPVAPVSPKSEHVEPEEIIMPTMNAAITNHHPRSAYEEYKQAFGFQLKMRRDERNMKLQEVADALTQSVSGGSAVSKEQIQHWEQARTLPNAEQMEALAKILIDENDFLQDKEAARQIFMQTYLRSKAAFEQSNHGDDRYAFASLLIDHHESLGAQQGMRLSLEALANKVSAHLKINLPKEEEERLNREPREFIASIEAGAVVPSRALTLALVAALDKTKPLPEDEKQTLYTALEKSSQAVALPVMRREAANENRENPGGAAPSETEKAPRAPRLPKPELSDEIKAAKRKLSAFFIKDENSPSLHQIGEDAGFGNSGNLVYALLSEKSKVHPRIVGALSDTVKTRLENYLRTHGSSDAEITHFQQAFNEMRQVTGHTSRATRPDKKTAEI